MDEIAALFGQSRASAPGSAPSKAVRSFAGEGREVLDALSLKIEEARAALAELEAARGALAAARGETGR